MWLRAQDLKPLNPAVNYHNLLSVGSHEEPEHGAYRRSRIKAGCGRLPKPS